jgi:hypothetical protein
VRKPERHQLSLPDFEHLIHGGTLRLVGKRHDTELILGGYGYAAFTKVIMDAVNGEPRLGQTREHTPDEV